MATNPSSGPIKKKPVYLQNIEELEKAFNRFDFNGDGRVAVWELVDVFHSLGSTVSNNKQLRSVMDELDSDQDGFFSLKDFAAYHQNMGKVESVFNRFDDNGDNWISVSDFCHTFEFIGPTFSNNEELRGTELGAVFGLLWSTFSNEEELRRVMDELESVHDGFISFNGFAAFCRSIADDGGASELRKAFRLYEQDQNGLISASELHLVVNRLGMNCSVEDCHRMIGSVDADGDGNVNFEEFERMMTNANKNGSSNGSAP